MRTNLGEFLGKLEKEVMEIVWANSEPISVKDTFEIISKRRKIAYTTILTIMNRLCDKGILKRKPSGKAYLYQATTSKDKFLTNVSKQIIKNFVSSFGENALAHFAQEVERIPQDKREKLLKSLKGAKK